MAVRDGTKTRWIFFTHYQSSQNLSKNVMATRRIEGNQCLVCRVVVIVSASKVPLQ